MLGELKSHSAELDADLINAKAYEYIVSLFAKVFNLMNYLCSEIEDIAAQLKDTKADYDDLQQASADAASQAQVMMNSDCFILWTLTNARFQDAQATLQEELDATKSALSDESLSLKAARDEASKLVEQLRTEQSRATTAEEVILCLCVIESNRT